MLLVLTVPARCGGIRVIFKNMSRQTRVDAQIQGELSHWNQMDENVSLVPSMISESAHMSSKGNIACIILLIIAERVNNLHDLAGNDHATALNESSVQLTDVLFFF